MSRTDILPAGPFATCDLDALGITRRQLRIWLGRGLVRRVVRGGYVPSTLLDSIEVRAEVVAAVVGPDHVITDRTAAWIHGIDALVYAELDLFPPIDCCALRGNEPSTRNGVAGRTRDLRERDIMTIGGVRVTTPLRTALDLGCLLRRREAMAALDAFARLHGLTAADLTRESARFRRRRGVVQLRELIPLIDPRAESARESWTRLAIHDDGLPEPDLQIWIEVDGVPTYRLDHGYRRARVAIEYDGFDAHERTTEQIEHDRARRRWLTENGWIVIVIRRGDFTGAALRRWLTELRAALRPTYSNVRRMERNSRLTGPELPTRGTPTPDSTVTASPPPPAGDQADPGEQRSAEHDGLALR